MATTEVAHPTLTYSAQKHELLASMPKAVSLQHHFNEYAKRLSRSSTSFLVSMPKGFLTLAQLAGECAQGLSRTSIIVWQVCHRGYLADVDGWLASMPKGCLAPACLLASMPKGYLAPASIAGEYAQGLSRSSIVCSTASPHHAKGFIDELGQTLFAGPQSFIKRRAPL